MRLTLGQQDPPIIFREGAVCPTGYLCVPGIPPVKLPDVQGQQDMPPNLSDILKAGLDPSLLDWVLTPDAS